MQRLPLLLLAVLILWAVGSPGRASVRSLRSLTVTERVHLQESERRLDEYDRALHALEIARKNKSISSPEYAYEYRDITAFMGEEAKYQDDILTKNSGFDEDAREVMQNVARYAVLVPAYILALAVKGAADSSYSFSP